MAHIAELLGKEIKAGLPGTAVQWEMGSVHRLLNDLPKIPGPDSTEAAVLILLYPEDNSVYTVLMQRPDYDGAHGGQISFPGGKKEAHDKTLIDTAIREAGEEAGIPEEEISVINTLTPLYIPVSDINVTPVLAWSKKKPAFRHHPDEVAFLFEVKLSRLANETLVKTTPMPVRGQIIDVKHYDYDGKVIWGATAMMLHELLVIAARGGIAL